MIPEIPNDNTAPDAGTASPDAHGHAAVLLIESLIHGLIARDVISPADAMEIVGIASDAETEIAADLGGAPAPARRPSAILQSISASLAYDVERD